MRKIILYFLLFTFLLSTSCSSLRRLGYTLILRTKLSIDEVIQKKEIIDSSENPAYKHLIIEDIRKCRVVLNNATVHDVTQSGNIDYQFCIIVKVPYKTRIVDCYIYAKDFYGQEDVETLADLKKGQSIIDVEGDFDRFFSLLDKAYTKVEITNAIVSVTKE